MIAAALDMHRHAGAAAALLSIAEERQEWPEWVLTDIEGRAERHLEEYRTARAAFLAAGGDLSDAITLDLADGRPVPLPSAVDRATRHADAIEGAQDALETAIGFGTAAQMDAAKARLDAAIGAARGAA